MAEYTARDQAPPAETVSYNPEVHPRAFRLETMPLDGDRTLTLAHFDVDYILDKRTIPPDWKEQLAKAIGDADLTFVEYCVPELERTVPYLHSLGSFSRNIINGYGDIASIAHSQGKDLAVADIANKPLFEAYLLGMPLAIGAAAALCARKRGILGWTGFTTGEAWTTRLAYEAVFKKGRYAVEPSHSRSEQYLPDATDARRVLTAEGIARTAQQYPPGSSFLYVAAPAHAARVAENLAQPPTWAASLKSAAYNHLLVGLDRGVRIYTPHGDGWQRKPDIPQ